MTLAEFKRKPLLLPERDVLQCLGISRNKLRTMVDCAALQQILPQGAGQVKYQKRQIGLIANWVVDPKTDETLRAFAKEAAILGEKAFMRYTGYCRETIIVFRQQRSAGFIRLAGCHGGFQKIEVAKLIGFEELV